MQKSQITRSYTPRIRHFDEKKNEEKNDLLKILTQKINNLEKIVAKANRKNTQIILDDIFAEYGETFLSMLKIKVLELLQIKQIEGKLIQVKKSMIVTAIIDKLKFIDLSGCLSVYKEKLSQFADEMKKLKHEKKGALRKITTAYNFLYKYTEMDMRSLVKPTYELLSVPKTTCQIVYNFYNHFCQRHNYRKLPSIIKIYAKGDKKIKQSISIDNVKRETQLLIEGKRYKLACLLWFVVCMGFRSSQLLTIFFMKQNVMFDVVKITQSKNKMRTVRIVPNSLKKLILLSGQSFPITKNQFVQVRRFAMEKFGRFYGLRSTCITSILISLTKSSEFAKMHRQAFTTIRYYVDKQAKDLINAVFDLEVPYQDVSDSNVSYDFDINRHEINDKQQIQIVVDDQINDVVDVEMEQGELEKTVEQIMHQITQNKNHSYMADLVSKYCEQQFNILIDSNCQIFKNAKSLLKYKFKSLLQMNIFQDELDDILKELPKFIKTDVYFLTFSYFVENIERKTFLCNSTDKLDYPFVIAQQKQTMRCRFNELNQFKIEILKTERMKIQQDIKTENPYVMPEFTPCYDCNEQISIAIRRDCQKLHFYCKCKFEGCPNINKVQQYPSFVPVYKDPLKLQLNIPKNFSTINNIMEQVQSTKRKYIKKSQWYKIGDIYNCTLPVFSNKLNEDIVYVNDNERFLPVEIKAINNEIIKGFGVFATQQIYANEIICLYSGQAGPSHLFQSNDSIFHVAMCPEQKIGIIIDSGKMCNAGRFINSCQNYKKINCKSVIALLKRRTYNEPVVLIYSIADIPIGEQLIYDYEQNYFD